MSFKGLALFAVFMFAIAAVNSPPAAACDTGGGQAGNPTFSIVQPQAQAFYAPQQVVTQQFVAQPQYVQQFAVQPQVQRFAVQHHQQAVVLQNVAPVHVQAFGQRAPRRQVTTTRQVTTQRTGGILGFRN
jgi:hypothetical protein